MFIVKRNKTFPVNVGGIVVGGDSPIVVQSMTDTDTSDVTATVDQILQLVEAGSEIVRLTVNNDKSAKSVPKIKKILSKQNCDVPLVGDFHYNGHKILSDYEDCAKALAKYRINPGNVGFKSKQAIQFKTMIDAAIRWDKPVRIGVNWGSLDKQLLARLMDENSTAKVTLSSLEVLHEALVQSAIMSAQDACRYGLPEDQIIISCKVSRVQDLIKVYTMLASRCDFALHLGLTEAGMGSKGIVASTAAMSILLQQGIGDTIRTSITPKVGGTRTEEVKVSQHILQSMGLRSFSPVVSSCPGCGRTTSSYFRELTEEIDQFLQQNMIKWRCSYPGVEQLKVAVMGCVVNGPGESKHADIGISLPGTGEAPVSVVFIEGHKYATLKGPNIAVDFKKIVKEYIHSKYCVKDTEKVT